MVGGQRSAPLFKLMLCVGQVFSGSTEERQRLVDLPSAAVMEMILKVLANAGQIMADPDTRSVQYMGRSNS